ncbi:polyketide cyclase [uncultured Jatrophihabitans sp.]|uniref:polyketide cyclase n=1 Tax=uncultured Jatrophihabitans sp. TaxID=1610747 RepID=UPI0035CA738B
MLGDRWGVTEAEVARRFPCDDLVASPSLAVWRGVTVEAAPEQVWPWVRQIRLAPYSYDWIDNLGRRSPRELRELPEPMAGEPFTASAGRPLGTVVSAAAPEHYTGRILGAVMSYVLVPDAPGRTRLLLKVVMDGGRWFAPLVSVGDLVMARRQLLTLKRLAEAG